MNRIVLILLALAITLPVEYISRKSVHDVPAAFFVQSSARTLVRISGDVRHPGIYQFFANQLTVDVINMAVPLWRLKEYVPTGSGQLPVSNGEEIRVARNRDGSAELTFGMIPVAQRIVLGIPLDMSELSTADLEQLPGIGPVLAQRITEYRQLNGGTCTIEDLKSINGIGEKKYNQFKRYFK